MGIGIGVYSDQFSSFNVDARSHTATQHNATSFDRDDKRTVARVAQDLQLNARQKA